MTERCADLDEFFDGELAADQADRFCDHLATCERCQDVLHGRMQERIVTQIPAAHLEPAAAPAAAAPAEPPAPVVSATEAPVAACAALSGGSARTRIFRRAMAYAAPLLAAAAAVPLYLAQRSDPDLELVVATDRAPVTERSDPDAVLLRSISVHTGDVVRPTVRGARHRAIWVYAGERSLVAACPGDARCKGDRGELTLELTLTVRGKYAIVALGSHDPLPAPGTTLDQARVLARRAGIPTELQYVEVE